ncbi:MAG: PTS system mannose/fructose/sorbose family transporter subunit IID [[Clostridium] innocuum]
MTAAVKKSKITKKELFRAYNKWYWLCEVSHCYDRLQSLSFCASIQNTLRKLYPNDEEYQESTASPFAILQYGGNYRFCNSWYYDVVGRRKGSK